MKASDILIDEDVYPRNAVDQHNVLSLCGAIEAGVTLPPIITDKRTRTLIDGRHRRAANIRLFGEDAKLDVVEKSYKGKPEMFLDAMRYNASHGEKLYACDHSRCLLIAEKLSIPLDAVAGALSIPASRLGPLRVLRVAKDSGGLSIPLKRTVSHFAGRSLTPRQEVANKNLSGMNQTFYVNQLVELIESGMLDMENELLFERLKVLDGLLDGVLCGA